MFTISNIVLSRLFSDILFKWKWTIQRGIIINEKQNDSTYICNKHVKTNRSTVDP